MTMPNRSQMLSGPFVPGVGAVLSADIAVPEHRRELRFYARVLSTGDNPLWRESDLMNNRGMPIVGVGSRTTEYAHLPLQWMPHIQVADVLASVKQALARGGTVLLQAKNQWAVLLDPNGAAFGIVPVVPAEAIPVEYRTGSDNGGAPVGRICGLDLTVPDASATEGFYQRVIGWSVRHVEIEDGPERYSDYDVFQQDGQAIGRIRHARGMNRGLPPSWMIHLPVGDLAESLRQVRTEGGEVIKTVPGEDGQDDYAAVRDPVGAFFVLRGEGSKPSRPFRKA